MQSARDSGSGHATEQALGRSTIDHHGQIDLTEQDAPSAPSAPGHITPLQTQKTPTHSIRGSFARGRHDCANQFRKSFHIRNESDEKEHSTAPILAGSEVGTSDSRLLHNLPVLDKPTFKDLFHDPVETIKSKISGQGSHQAAANIAAKEISHGQEVDLVNASDRVEHAHTNTERLLALQDLDRLIKERQTMYVRWTVDRHVTKCRILPRESFVRKSRHAFENKDLHGNVVMDWRAYVIQELQYYALQYGGQYIGYGSEPPLPSKESIMPNFERIIIASVPFQKLIMTARRVYRWEYPAETTKYLVSYSILWYLNLLLPGAISVVIYLVIHRHFNGNTIDDIRKDIKRTEDIHQTAFTLTDFIEKEGDEVWTEQILQQLGPWLMIQLCDAANMCEVMGNFYEWTVPSSTWVTLSILLAFAVITTLAPAWLLLKLMTLSMGFTFFGLFPLATNYPDYRLLASVPKRIFWNIPTHAEWAFKSLQAEGLRYQHTTRPEVETPRDVDYGYYNAHHDKDKGRLILSAHAVRFETNIGHRLLWTVRYDQITNLEKKDRVATKDKPTPSKDSGMDLRVVSKAGHEWVLLNMDERNQAFSQIIGFSHTPWQIVW